MATAAASVEDDVDLDFREVVEFYRIALAEPAVFPWVGGEWEPVRIGPTWQTTEDGYWLLPDHTIGWSVLGWMGSRLELDGEPFRPTMEQARFLLWWYAIGEDGRFLFRDGVFQRLKGHGKDPLGSALAAVEGFGPCRFLEWDDNGNPVATDSPAAWVQLAAVSLEQTKNTTRMFPSLFPKRTRREYRIPKVGKELIYGLDDTRLIQAVTSSASTMEGPRSTFILLNETHHWVESNEGHAMSAVIRRNAAKSADGAARTLAITNAFQPGQDSVAERTREAWELAEAGESLTDGILYDSLEAPPEAPLTAEAAPGVVLAIRGDSVWLDPDRMVAEILDTRNPPSQSRRFWYNQIVAAEDAWVDPIHFAACSAKTLVNSGQSVGLVDGDEITLFFDGSKSDDATGLVACRVSDGHVATMGMWVRPSRLDKGELWTVPRNQVDALVESVFDRFNVAAFFADPSHALEDVTEERYWDALIDEWHHRYSKRLMLWADRKGRHSVMWDMTNRQRTAEFVDAAERCEADIRTSFLERQHGRPATFTHDGDGRLRRHVENARRWPTKHGVSLGKEKRGSRKKIDLAVCMVGARMLRRKIEMGEGKKRRSGKVW